MKKLLGILVLGLLLGGCSTSTVEEVMGNQYERLYVGMSKESVRKKFIPVIIDSDPTFKTCSYNYFPNIEAEILSSKDNSTHLVITEVRFEGRCNSPSGSFHSIHNTFASAKKVVDNMKSTVELNEEKKIAEKKKKEQEKKKKLKQTPDDNKIVPAASGTGFFVSNTGHIVTNHHVIDQCKVVKVNYKGNEIEAKVLAIDKTNDLAILETKINPSKVYAVSNKDVALLEDVIVAGFPLGKRVSSAIKTHKGSVTALAGYGDNYSNFQTDATINQGNSGGPVMDQKGNIVGVAVALMSAEAGQNIFFAVKSSTLKIFANANSINFLPPNNREMPNAELGQLITEGTLFLECWMTVAKIKQIIAQEENRKAFYSKFK